MIPQNFIEEVQTRTDVVELISSYIPLKRAGRNFKGICPFHGEKTPSFMVSPQKQIFHCFGCGEGGGTIQFLMSMEKVTFVEAVEILANKAGLTIPYQKTDQHKKKASLYDVVEKATDFFHSSLMSDVGKPILDYLNKRGVDEDTIKKFKIGYAPGRNTLISYLRGKDFTLDVLEKGSLVISRNGSYRDLFIDRIIFPVFDVRCRPVAFGARLWKDIKDAPKYINSIENPLYSKRDHLFGLNLSKEAIMKNDYAIVVEGYMDMITPFMNGVENIVASMGTALTIEQINLIRRFTSNVVLIFDSDKAGQLASLRSVDLLLENDLRVKVAQLPQGTDPDSLIKQKGKEAFLGFLEARKDFFDYKLDILKTIHDVDSIEGKTEIVKEVFLTIDRLSSEVEKYDYISKLSNTLKVKEEVLIAEFRKAAFKSKIPARRITIENQGNPLDRTRSLTITEKTVLKFAFSGKKTLPVLRKNVKEEDFNSYIAKKTFSYILRGDHLDVSSRSFLATIEDKEISGFISQLLMDDMVPCDKESVKGAIIKLRKKRMGVLVKKQKEDAIASGDNEKLKSLYSKK